MTGNWLVVHGPERRCGVRLVCLPHAGGSASYFPWLRRALPADGELVCVQYPGRQERRREPAIEDVPTMVASIAVALDERPRAPTVLYGHSLGALLAFELARWFDRHGAPPAGLVVSGRRGPAVRVPTGAVDLNVEEILARLRELGGVESTMLDDPDLRELVLPVVRADYRLAESYRYRRGARMSCPITVLTGSADPAVSDSDARAWARHTNGEFRLLTMSGGHFFISDHRNAVADELRSVLATVGVRRPRRHSGAGRGSGSADLVVSPENAC